MVQLSLSTSLPAPRAPGGAGFPALPGGFALTLAGVSASATGTPGAPIDLPAAPDERQPDAVSGKSLPAGAAQLTAINDPSPLIDGTSVPNSGGATAIAETVSSPLSADASLPGENASAAARTGKSKAAAPIDARPHADRKRARRSQAASDTMDGTLPTLAQAGQALVPPLAPASAASVRDAAALPQRDAAAVSDMAPLSRRSASTMMRAARDSRATLSTASVDSTSNGAPPPPAGESAAPPVAPALRRASVAPQAALNFGTSVPIAANTPSIASSRSERATVPSTGTPQMPSATSRYPSDSVLVASAAPIAINGGAPAPSTSPVALRVPDRATRGAEIDSTQLTALIPGDAPPAPGAAVSIDASTDGVVNGASPSAAAVSLPAGATTETRAQPVMHQAGPQASTGGDVPVRTDEQVSALANSVVAPARPGSPAPVLPAAAPLLLPATPGPAAIVFGPALAIAFADRRTQGDDARKADDGALLAGLMPSAASSSVSSTTLAAAAPLDMRRDDWPQAMLDRIEALRDAADANDTRIRLLPDALGKVDVSLHHDGDAVRVHFAAELPTTQTLLNNAQPRLAELGQARGVRISQNAVDTGGAGTGQQQRGTLPHAPRSTRPASAATTVVDAGADSRLA